MWKTILEVIQNLKILMRSKIIRFVKTSEVAILLTIESEFTLRQHELQQQRRKELNILSRKVFGNERLGLSSFIQLKRTATQLKVSSNCRIKMWSQRFNTFQDYLPRTLWIAGVRRSKWPTTFDK